MTGKQCYGIGQSGKRIDLDQTESGGVFIPFCCIWLLCGRDCTQDIPVEN